jgi:alkyl sulfatase BDS1-like metallo-beta-lactamase superfamily hydrolase
MARAMSVTQLFDAIALRIDGPRAAGTALSVLWHFTDSGEHYHMELSNGVLIHYPTKHAHDAGLTLSLTHPRLLGLLASGSLQGIGATGDPGVLKTLMSLTDEPDPSFPVVTP